MHVRSSGLQVWLRDVRVDAAAGIIGQGEKPERPGGRRRAMQVIGRARTGRAEHRAEHPSRRAGTEASASPQSRLALRCAHPRRGPRLQQRSAGAESGTLAPAVMRFTAQHGIVLDRPQSCGSMPSRHQGWRHTCTATRCPCQHSGSNLTKVAMRIAGQLAGWLGHGASGQVEYLQKLRSAVGCCWFGRAGCLH